MVRLFISHRDEYKTYANELVSARKLVISPS